MRDSQILVQSLVEGDPARVVRFRRLRRRAVLLSVAVEAMLLAALLLAPLASPGTLRRRLDWTPIPPYGGSPRATDVASHPPIDRVPHHYSPNVTLFEPPSIPPRVDGSGDQKPEETGATPGEAIGEGTRDGLVPVPLDGNPRIRISEPKPPQPVEHPPHTVVRGEGVQSALLSYRVVPAYPILARLTRTEGEVKLHAIIATDGTIRLLEVESGPPLLIQAAIDAVRQWRYKPALLNGQPVEVDTSITVIFHLQR